MGSIPILLFLGSILFLLFLGSIFALHLANQAWSTSHEEDPAAEAEMRMKFEEFVAEFGKVYEDTKEKEMRFEIFKRKVAEIDALKAENDWMGINIFSDLTREELSCEMFGCRTFYDHVVSLIIYSSGEPLVALAYFLIFIVFPIGFLIGVLMWKMGI
ncbi:Fruit bromelain [Linum grandiflorum]